MTARRRIVDLDLMPAGLAYCNGRIRLHARRNSWIASIVRDYLNMTDAMVWAIFPFASGVVWCQSR